MGGGGSLGKNGGSQRSRSTTQQNVWNTQAPYLASLYGGAQSLANQQGPAIGEAAGQQSQAILGGQGGFGANATNPAIANLMQRAGGQSPFLQQQVAQLGQNIGQNLQQNILPGLGQYYGSAGGYGGGRMGVDMGRQAMEAQRQFQQGATSLYANDYNQGQQAAGMAGQLGAQGVQAGQGQYQLGMSPFAAQWQPYQQLAGIIGGPTVLGQGNSSAGGWNAGFTSSGNFGFGGMGGG